MSTPTPPLLSLSPQDVLAALEALGATTIAFNPVTTLNISKALQRIAQQRGFELPPASAAAIAEGAAGDLRNAVTTLQLQFGGAQHGGAVARQVCVCVCVRLPTASFFHCHHRHTSSSSTTPPHALPRPNCAARQTPEAAAHQEGRASCRHSRRACQRRARGARHAARGVPCPGQDIAQQAPGGAAATTGAAAGAAAATGAGRAACLVRGQSRTATRIACRAGVAACGVHACLLLPHTACLPACACPPACAWQRTGNALAHFSCRSAHQAALEGNVQQSMLDAGGAHHIFQTTLTALCPRSCCVHTTPRRLQRPPSKYRAEDIVQQSALDAGSVAAFLHENYPNFVELGAAEDVAASAAYLSDAGGCV